MFVNNTEKSDSTVSGNLWDFISVLSMGDFSYTSDDLSIRAGKNNVFALEDAVTACSCKADKCAITLIFKK